MAFAYASAMDIAIWGVGISGWQPMTRLLSCPIGSARKYASFADIEGDLLFSPLPDFGVTLDCCLDENIAGSLISTALRRDRPAVSYTHLTLPTIYSV